MSKKYILLISSLFVLSFSCRAKLLSDDVLTAEFGGLQEFEKIRDINEKTETYHLLICSDKSELKMCLQDLNRQRYVLYINRFVIEKIIFEYDEETLNYLPTTTEELTGAHSLLFDFFAEQVEEGFYDFQRNPEKFQQSLNDLERAYKARG